MCRWETMSLHMRMRFCVNVPSAVLPNGSVFTARKLASNISWCAYSSWFVAKLLNYIFRAYFGSSIWHFFPRLNNSMGVRAAISRAFISDGRVVIAKKVFNFPFCFCVSVWVESYFPIEERSILVSAILFKFNWKPWGRKKVETNGNWMVTNGKNKKIVT